MQNGASNLVAGFAVANDQRQIAAGLATELDRHLIGPPGTERVLSVSAVPHMIMVGRFIQGAAPVPLRRVARRRETESIISASVQELSQLLVHLALALTIAP